MDPDDYCQAKGPAAGSSAYYAVQFAPDRSRARALYALLRDLHAIVATVSDKDVASAKLAWWQAELGGLASNAGTHPITQALAKHGYAGTAAREALLRATLAIDTDLHQTRFLDESSLNGYCSAAGGAPLEAYAHASGIETASVLAALVRLGAGIARARLILRIGYDGRRGRIYLPHDTLRRFELPAADILNARQTPRLIALAGDEATRATEAIRASIELLAPEHRKLRAAVILGRLNIALLAAARADGFQVALHRVSLTPLAKFFIAWRTTVFA